MVTLNSRIHRYDTTDLVQIVTLSDRVRSPTSNWENNA
jgi:hypothetical protein